MTARHKEYKQEAFVDNLEKAIKLSEKTKKAFLKIPRELFIPVGLERFAYDLEALPMGAKQWLSSPLTVAKMTEALELDQADSVLEIGCGSGYQAAILSQIVRRVFTIERIDSLIREAKARFKSLQLVNITAKLDDGHDGWVQFAPFDRIIFSCEVASVPEKLLDQLSKNGIIVAPVNGNITKYTKHNSGRVTSEVLDGCQFVPMLKGIER